MKKRTIFKVILIILLALFLAFWITAFIKVCPSYGSYNVYGIFNPDYEDTIYDKIFDKVCPSLLKLTPLSFIKEALAAGLLDTDLENLKNSFPNLIKAYEKVSVFQSWNIINTEVRLFSTVNIGVLDTGIDASDGRHPELEGVDLGKSTIESLRDNAVRLRSDLTAGHGTQVAGIIGANNLSKSQTLPVDSPQMNGVVSGVSGLPYIMESRGTIFDILKLGRDLETLPQKSIINMSYGNSACPKIFFIERKKRFCVKETDFEFLSNFYSETFTKNGDKFFVVGAGNDNIDTKDFTPANIQLDNTITVGATDLNDNRADFGFLLGASNFGDSVNISAPGIQIYAPSIRGKGNFPISGTDINNYITDFSGTSASAPLVTGVAAILKALEPEYQKHNPGLVMTPAKIKEVLMKSADPIKTDKPLGRGCFTAEKNPSTGYNGCRLNAHRAVVWLLPPTPVILNTPVVVPAP